MKAYKLFIGLLLLTGCTQTPVPEKEKEQPKPQQTKKSLQAKSTQQSTSKQTVTQPAKQLKKLPDQKTVPAKKTSLKVAKEKVSSPVKEANIPTSRSSQTDDLIVGNQLWEDEHRYLYVIGKELAPVNKQFAKLLHIPKGQNSTFKTFNQFLNQREIRAQSNFITMLTLSDFLEQEPLIKTLQAIENMPTRKSFFIIFYNHEKNIRELLENRLLNGMKNILLFVPMTHKTSVQYEPSIQKLARAMSIENITFKQLYEALCESNTKECTSFFRGNNYLLY